MALRHPGLKIPRCQNAPSPWPRGTTWQGSLRNPHGWFVRRISRRTESSKWKGLSVPGLWNDFGLLLAVADSAGIAFWNFLKLSRACTGQHYTYVVCTRMLHMALQPYYVTSVAYMRPGIVQSVRHRKSLYHPPLCEVAFPIFDIAVSCISRWRLISHVLSSGYEDHPNYGCNTLHVWPRQQYMDPAEGQHIIRQQQPISESHWFW